MAPRIPFEHAPAAVTIGEGLRIATRYWAATIERWILAVVAVALVQGLASWLLFGRLSEDGAMALMMRSVLQGQQLDPGMLPSVLAGPLAIAIVSLVAGWFLTANAVAGLRGTELALGWVLPAGLRAMVAGLLIGVTALLAMTMLLLLGVAGVLLLLALLPVGFYLFLRVSFWELSIFDGASIAAGLDRSWRITRGAVLRLVGWSLLIAALSLGVLVFETLVTLPIGAVSRPAAAAVTGAIDLGLAAYTSIVFAILYESQLARRTLVPPPVPVARSPFDPPPPPGF